MSTANPRKRFLYDDSPNSPTSQSADQKTEKHYASSATHDRQSTFIAYFHPGSDIFSSSTPTTAQKPNNATTTTGNGNITTLIKRLQNHPSFHDASHRIVAWRRRSNQQTLFAGGGGSTTTTTHQSPSRNISSQQRGATPTAKVIYTVSSLDDGEKYAGKHVEKILNEMDVEGVIVVARWYGGVMLGPVRFAHIENCAREAVRLWMDSTSTSTGNGKRIKLLDDPRGDGAGIEDEAQRSRLARQLVARDESITVLRGLLAEKMQAKSQNQSQAQSQSQTQSTATFSPAPTAGTTDPSSQQHASAASGPAAPPAKGIYYSTMPLSRLRQLEKARDASIAFILKQLDKIEQEEIRDGTEQLATKIMENAASAPG